MFQTLKFRITGVSPLLMHNGQLADPLNAWTKRIKSVSGKRAKTDADLEELARLEWLGSLYLKGGRPCIPGEIIEATLGVAARKIRKGKSVLAGLICPEHAILEFGDDRPIEQLWEDENFRLVAGVRVQRAKIMRTRPCFKSWGADVSIQFEDTLLNAREVVECMETAGNSVGFCDWRPKFGRFSVELIK